MTNVTRQWAWPAYPYAAQLPPPLCFTEPAALPRTRGTLQVSPPPALTPAAPHLMMDPSDPSTWQRPYRFAGSS